MGLPSPPSVDSPHLTPQSPCSNIVQLDGNISLSSSLDLSLDDFVSDCIPVHTGFRPLKPVSARPPSVRRAIRRDNKALQGLTLPKVSCYNMRSLIPKVESLGNDMQDRNCSLSFLSEIWTKSEKKSHQYKLEELFELKGLKYISTPRSGTRRGGGVAILVNTEKFSISKLNVEKPICLEVVWGLLRPLETSGNITKIIVCCFYCPPKSKRKTILIEHLTLTLQTLLNSHQNAGIIISGDKMI